VKQQIPEMVSSTMRVLLCHVSYRQSGGEDMVYANEHRLLQSQGITVIPFARNNKDIDESGLSGRLALAKNTAWCNQAYKDITEEIHKSRPDIAHFHNTFPLLSPSVYAACRDQGIPVVQTLHNYRLICPGGTLERAGHVCEDCVGTSLWPALRHRCYRDSLPATAAVVWMLARNRLRGTYQQLVNQYIALTRFAADRLINGGLPQERVAIKPNFLPNPPLHPGAGDGNYAVYVGRLSREKGLHTLLSAWRQVRNLPLKIIGDGPLRAELEQQVQQEHLSVEFLGFRAHPDVLDQVARATLQVIPSECYEGFPMTVLEAYACGTPVLASRLGSLDEIVIEGETGLKFGAGDADDLKNKVLRLQNDPELLGSLRRGARQQFEGHYTADRNFRALMTIYERVLQKYKGTSSP
jgi:glycosyltransferase involved in cell wall biosynthesis